MVNLIKSNKINTLKSISNILDTVVDKNDYKLEFQNGLYFDYFNKDTFEDTLLIVSDAKLLGIGKVVEGKIKPVRVFNL